ncbi:MAG: glycerol-3-phosphate acyltransferase [Candidatus Nanopelagicales bacterium]
MVVGALGGYALGAVNPASLVARARGVDLRAAGSGNPGATNAGRVLGPGFGVLVGVLDVLKGFVPAFVLSRYGGAGAGEIAGLAAVVGHITSPYLRGRGGKGVATALGAILGVQPLWAIPVLAVFGVVVLLTHRVGLGAVAGSLTLVPVALLTGGSGWDVGFAAALTVLIVARHRDNLRAAFRSGDGGSA